MHLNTGYGWRRSAGLIGLICRRCGGLRTPLRLRAVVSWLALVVCAVMSVDAYAIPRPKHVLALVPRPTESRPKRVLALVPRLKPTDARPRRILALVSRPKLTDSCAPAPVNSPFALPPDALALASMNAMPADAPVVKQAVEHVRKRKISQATQLEKPAREP